DVHLERREAALEHATDHLLDLAEIHARLDLAGGVDADLVAELATHQIIDRRLERLALQIPQRDLDPGQRGDQRAGEAAVEHVAAAQILEDRVDLERVAPDKLGAQLVDDRDRLHAAMHTLA